MMKYKEPDMVLLQIDEMDVVTASELKITDPLEAEYSDWESWL